MATQNGIWLRASDSPTTVRYAVILGPGTALPLRSILLNRNHTDTDVVRATTDIGLLRQNFRGLLK